MENTKISCQVFLREFKQATDRARGLTTCNNILFWTEVRFSYYCTMITSAAKITRHLADAVNYPLCFNQSRTRIKFE